MEEREIEEVLREIQERIGHRQIVWCLAGSTNLRVQGISINVKDRDITTNDEGIKGFRTALGAIIEKDFFNKRIAAKSLCCTINGHEIEINAYTRKELEMLDKAKSIVWNRLEIPVLPLNYAKIFYELTDRKEKAELIGNQLT